MESPRKNNDCYFYYYSTCTKGDSCTFRHEPSALGCETMCSYWQQGKCLNQHCNFRHMELRKNRKAIPCYWETQPTGCRKPHCPFQHKNPRETVKVDAPPSVPVPSVDGAHEQQKNADWNRRQVVENNQHVVGELTANDIECARQQARRMNPTGNDTAPNFGTPAVDPLVVNFEEESDNESTSTTPIKRHNDRVSVKTLEMIRLEKVQQQTAAIYDYDRQTDLRQRLQRPSLQTKDFQTPLSEIGCTKQIESVRIKTLDELRAERELRNKLDTKEWSLSSQVTKRLKRSLSYDLNSSEQKLEKIPRTTILDVDDGGGVTDVDSSKLNTHVPDLVVDAVAKNIEMTSSENILKDIDELLAD